MRLLAEKILQSDAAQARVVAALEARLEALRPVPGILGVPLFSEPSVRGLYLWGGVGRGKTMLMDMFFSAADVPKARFHFHEFMQKVHQLRHQGTPISSVVSALLGPARLICFDEFQVHDIADASILSRLFGDIFARNAVVVATSNRAPEALYEGGLHRERFVPFIALLKTHMEVVAVDGERDYRRDRLAGEEVYFSPVTPAACAAQDALFARLTAGAQVGPCCLEVHGRPLEVPQAALGVARFPFEELCVRPRGPGDYLALAKRFRVLFLEAIPLMGPKDHNIAKRFMALIDILYEHKVCLIATAQGPPEALYTQGQGAVEFARTASRLMEMRSSQYGAFH